MYGILKDDTKAKVGDKVRVVKSGHAPGGSEHEASVGDAYEMTLDCGTGIHARECGGANVWFFYNHEVEPVSDTALKVGDRVRVIKLGGERDGSGHGAKIGDVVTLREWAAGGEFWRTNSYDFYPHEIALITNDVVKQVQRDPKFKVGQRVRVIDADGGGKLGDVGVVADVIKNDESPFYYAIDGLSAGAHGLYEHRLQPAFLPGDRVRVTSCNGYFAAGDEGEVEKQDDYNVFVKHGSYQRIGLPIEPEKLVLIAARGASNDNQVVPKFKAGDRVRVIKDGHVEGGSWHGKDIGEEDTIIGLPTEHDDRYEGVSYYYNSDEIELVATVTMDTTGYVSGVSFQQPQPCIVARLVDGQPRPSNIPYVHPDIASAITEAERLATNNPGKEFAVYQRVTARVAEVSYTMKEVA